MDYYVPDGVPTIEKGNITASGNITISNITTDNFYLNLGGGQ